MHKTHIYMPICVHRNTFFYTHTSISTHVYVATYIYMYLYTHTHRCLLVQRVPCDHSFPRLEML